MGHQRSYGVSRSPEMQVKELTNLVGLCCEMPAFPKPAERGAVPCSRAATTSRCLTHRTPSQVCQGGGGELA